jgi:hypothetical protein
MKKEKNIFYIMLAVCLVCLLLWSFLFWLIWQAQKTPEKVEASAETLFSESDLESLRRFWGSLETQLAAVEGQFIDKDMTVDFIEEIESVARQTDVALKVTGAQDSPDIVVSFTGEGNFRNLLQFQLLLENLPHKLFFNKFSIYKKSVASGESWLIDAAVKLESVK